MKVFNVGVVGAGSIARLVHLPVLLNMPNVRVAWVTDARKESADTLAGSFEVPTVPLPASAAQLPPADVVLLATPVGVRMPYYEALAARGTAVFAEKPFAVTLAEHRRVAGLFQEHALGCGYMRRTYESSQILKQAIAEQWFGPLTAIRISEGARTVRTGVDASHYDDAGAAGGGVLMTVGTHSIDLAFHLTGATRFEILAREFVWDRDIDRKASTRMRLLDSTVLPAEGVELGFTVSWLDPQANEVELLFPRARLVAGIAPDLPVRLFAPGDSQPRAVLSPPRRGPTTAYQAFFTEWDWFLRDLEAGRPSPVSAASALVTTAAVEALYAGGGREA